MPLVLLGYDTEEENVFQHIFSKEISAILSDRSQGSYRISAKLEDGLRLLCLQLLPTGDRFPQRLTLMMMLTLTMRMVTTLARRKSRAEKWISLSLSALLKIVEAKDKMGSVRRRRTLELPFN